MKHCVFQCEYYAKTDSVILSAHDHSGNRIETVEFSLSQGKVVQSRGVCNSNTEFHDRIIRLVNENAYRFMEARRDPHKFLDFVLNSALRWEAWGETWNTKDMA